METNVRTLVDENKEQEDQEKQLFEEIAHLYKHSETIKHVNDTLLDEINRNLNNDEAIRQKLDR